MKRGPKPRSLAERFLSHVHVTDGCWLWTGHRNARGYGQIAGDDGRKYVASRVAYELYVGPRPAHLNVLLHCDNPSCVNPEHLFLGTQQDNSRDMVAKARCRPAGNSYSSTHCPHGHPRTPENTEVRKRANGGDVAFCLPCRAIYRARQREKERAKRTA